jgi:PAS domain S-box-containing protein
VDRILLPVLAVLLFLTASASAKVGKEATSRQYLTLGDPPLPVTKVTPFLSVFVDPTAERGIEEIMALDEPFEPNTQNTPLFGFTRAAVWLRFTIRSEADHEQFLLAELGTARLSHVTWYVVADGRVESSLACGANDSPRRTSRLPTLTLKLPPGAERTIYLRAASNTSIQLPLWLGQLEEMHQRATQQATGDALLIGFCLAIAFFGLLVGWVQHSRLYPYLAILAGAYTLYYALFHGYVTKAWPGAPLWIERQLLGWVIAIALLAFAFINGNFIGRSGMSRLELILQRIAEWLPVISMAAFLIFEFSIAIRWLQLTALGGCLAGLLLVLRRGRQSRQEIWFAAAWGGLGLALLVFSLQFNNLIPMLISFRILQLLILPTILVALFLAALVRQRAIESEKQRRTAERQAYELVGNIEAGTYEATLLADGKGGIHPQFRFVSAQFLEMFGLEREAFLACPAMIVGNVHPEDGIRLQAANAEAFATKGAFRWEGRVRANDETKWFVIASTPRTDDDGTTVWSGLVTDVTAEKEAQASLRQTLEDLPVAVACGTLDDPPRISLLNDQFIKTFGYDHHEILTVAHWAELAYPDAEYRREIMTWSNKALDEARRVRGKAESREVRVRCKDGTEKEAFVSATVLPTGPVLVFQDVTERNRVARELEAMRRSREKSAYELTENMPAGTYALTLTPLASGGVDMEFRFASTRFLELFGLDREALMQDPNLAIHSIHPDDRDSMNESNARAYAAGRPFHWEGRTLINGQTRWMNISSNPRVALDGVTVWEGVVSDITTRVEAERMLKEALENEKCLRAEAESLRQEAEQSHRAKSLFLAKMSHEIRTPLSVLVSLSQAMWMRGEQQEIAPEFTRFLNRVRSGGQYLNLLLRNILNVSAAESGRVPVRASEFYLADWLGEIRNILDPIAEYHRSAIEWTLPEDDEARWRTDQMRLTQIALNLGENALKFNTDGHDPVCIEIRISGDHLCLVVKDSGPGIPPDMKNTVFHEFARAGVKVSPLDEGFGLGLSVVKINTELLGGTVCAEPLLPKGTRFVVEIPAMSLLSPFHFAQSPDFFSSKITPIRRGGPCHSLRALRILYHLPTVMRTLIVEDSCEDLLNLRLLLERVAYLEIVGEATSLSAAREKVAETSPDLVFLDIELGPENGFDLLKHLPQGTRIIFTTVHTGYGAAAFEVDAADYVIKPVSEERLLRALAKLRSPDAAPLTYVQVYRGGSERHQLALEAIAAIKADRDHSIVICGSRQLPDHRRFREWAELLDGKNFSQLDRSTLVRLDLVHSWQPMGFGLNLRFRNSPVELELGRAAARRFEELLARA